MLRLSTSRKLTPHTTSVLAYIYLSTPRLKRTNEESRTCGEMHPANSVGVRIRFRDVKLAVCSCAAIRLTGEKSSRGLNTTFPVLKRKNTQGTNVFA